MECMSVCWPDQQGRSRALRRKRQSAAMTMTGGARRRHPRMSGRFCAAMGGRPYQWSSACPPPSRPVAAPASMEDLREQRQNLTNALHQRTNVLGSSPQIKFPPTRRRQVDEPLPTRRAPHQKRGLRGLPPIRTHRLLTAFVERPWERGKRRGRLWRGSVSRSCRGETRSRGRLKAVKKL